ncbi:3-oxoacyl-ACP synthase, partial [Streptomyces lasiicapitis]
MTAPAPAREADVVVTGLGLVTAAGIGVDATWAGVCRGESAAATDPGLAGLPVDISCTVPGFSARQHVGRRSSLTHDRFSQLSRAAPPAAGPGTRRAPPARGGPPPRRGGGGGRAG